MLCKLTLLNIALALPSLVNAHGFVRSVAINGQVFQGNAPNAASKASAIRQIDDFGPVKGAMNMAINCGQNAVIASQSLQANPGDKVEFEWVGGGGGNWPHNTGPMMTYMASCGSVTCDKFDAGNAKWFKIQQVARKTDGSGSWAQQDIMNGAKAVVYVPSNLAPGNYLMRHEILALHIGMSLGGAEFYPSCTQITVGGSGTAGPQANELVSLPGAYSDNDPGIFDKDAYNPSADYVFPGPPVASFVNSGRGNAFVAVPSATQSDSESATIYASPTPAAYRSADEGEGVPCDDMQADTVVLPVRRSRIMRDLDASRLR